MGNEFGICLDKGQNCKMICLLSMIYVLAIGVGVTDLIVIHLKIRMKWGIVPHILGNVTD